ncbi:DNA repair protein RecO [bacterium]|nr:DNA repair protein RecO [bacterium]
MEWQDEGIVLAVRRHGETSAIVQAMTASHGRAAGLVKGAMRGKQANLWQVGQVVELRWSARLQEHLGIFGGEMVLPAGSLLMRERAALAALQECLPLLSILMAEHESHPDVYVATRQWLQWLCEKTREMAELQASIAVWQGLLLEDIGYGFDWLQCAATGEDVELTHVSPKSGGAVGAEAARPYEGRLLKLPAWYREVMLHKPPNWLEIVGHISLPEAAESLAISRHFLYQWALLPIGKEPTWNLLAA